MCTSFYFNTQIHFPLDGLPHGVDLLQDLSHRLHETVTGHTGLLVLEFRQKLCGGHRFTH